MVAQVATECMVRAKAKGQRITKESLYEELLAMNGDNAFIQNHGGTGHLFKTDKQGVDTLQLYAVQNGEFKSVGKPFIPEYTGKIK
jgi:branched-chain amino acid transport system substrate-binding protein